QMGRQPDGLAELLGGLVNFFDGLAAFFRHLAEDRDGAAVGSSREDDRPLSLYLVARLRKFFPKVSCRFRQDLK
ncbi:MAG TPA: hypothetical protein VIK53_03240, partial [Verrucomicrobiae bacterium]